MGTRSSAAGTNEFYLAASALVVLAAFCLRIYQIGQEELWFDEAAAFYMVTIAKWPEALLSHNTPPLYSLLLTAWIAVFGQSESALRMLSAVFGTAFVAAVIWFGRRLLNRPAALWSGAISAVAPVQIYYSQEARTYALLLLFLALAYGSLSRALETRKRRWWAAFSVCVLLSLYSHYFAFLGLAPTALLVWIWPFPGSPKEKWRGYAIAASAGLLLFLPWLLWSFQSVSDSIASIDWIRHRWRGRSLLYAIPESLEVFTLGSEAEFRSVINVKRFGDIVFPFGLRITGLGVAALLGIWAALPWGEKKLAIPGLKRRKAWLWTLLFFPLAALWLISFYKPVYVVGRYDVIAFPAFALLLGLALAKIQSGGKAGPLLASFAAILLLIPVGSKLVYYYSVPPRLFERATAVALHEFVRNQDVLVLSRRRARTTIYYLTRLGYRWGNGRCHDGEAGHSFSCWMFPSITRPRSTMSAQVQEHLRALEPPDGVLFLVSDGEVLSDGRLKVGPLESLLVAELEKANLHPVPVDRDNAIIQFR